MADWYYMYEGQQHGPVTGAQLKSMAATGSIGREDFVWNEAMTEWVAAKRVRGLTFTSPSSTAPPQPGAPKQYNQGYAQAAPAPAAAQEAEDDFVPQNSYIPTAASEPAAEAVAPQSLNYAGGSAYEVSPRTIELLRQTRPWVMLISILMFIATGGIALTALIWLIGLIAGAAAMASQRTGSATALLGFGAAGIVFAIFFLIYGAILFFPGFFLMKYAMAIGRLATNRRTTELEAAIKAQKSYWMFIGILTLVGIGLWASIVLYIVALH